MRFLMMAGLLTVSGVAAAADKVPEREADESKTGDLGEGKVIPTDWAHKSSVACFPAPEDKYFNGNVVFYRWSQPASNDLYFRVTPADGVDINMYAIQVPSAQKGATPPDVSSAFRCHKAYSKYDGEVETMHVEGYKGQYEVVLGVASTTGTTAGSFTLEVWKQKGRQW